jgi:hypothetical protein
VEVRNTIQSNTQGCQPIKEVIVFVYSSLVESRCPCPDVGEAILVGSLRPIRTARETLGGRTLRTPIMRRLRADRGDNPAPGTWCYIEKIVDEWRAIRQRTQFSCAGFSTQ